MEANQLIELLHKPHLVAQQSVDDLKELAEKYPYSQPVQLLYTLRLSQSSRNYLFNQQLGKTAMLSNNREVLFDLFEREVEEEENWKDSLERYLSDSIETETEEEALIEESVLEEEPKEELQVESPEEELPVEEEILAVEELIEQEEQSEEEVVVTELEEPRETLEVETEIEKPITVAIVDEPPVAKPKLNLEGLSPAEKVKAILDENRKLREDFKHKKETGASLSDKQKVSVPETVEEEKQTADEPVEEVTELIEEVTVQPETPEPILEKEEVALEVIVEEESAEVVEVTEKNKVLVEEESLLDKEPIVMAFEIEEPIDEVMDEKAETVEEVVVDDDMPVFVIGEEEAEEPEIEEEPIEELTVEENEESENESRSFSGWLKQLNKEPVIEVSKSVEKIENETPEKERKSFESKIELLDAFVEKLPEIKNKAKEKVKPAQVPNMDLVSGEEGALVTETLAKVYVQQKHYKEAIKAYQILQLKYPEKSSFFADRILEIKNLNK